MLAMMLQLLIPASGLPDALSGVTVAGGEGDGVVMEEVVVKGEREPEEEKDVSATVTIIDVDRFRDRVSSVPDLLDQVAGVEIRQLGGVGSFSTISIRGSTSEQVVILLDGVELNRARSGVVDISKIPIDIVDRIEIYRGTSPAKFSDAGIGGVVNIITKKPRKKRLRRWELSAGSFGTFGSSYTESSGFGKDRYGYLLFAKGTHTDGNFEYFDDNGTPYNEADDEWTRRKNNRRDDGSIVAKLRMNELGAFRLDFAQNVFICDQGLPGIGAYQSEVASLETFRSITSMKLSSEEAAWGDLDADIGFFFNYEEQRFHDPEGEIGVGNQDNRQRTCAGGLNFLASYPVTPWLLLYLNTGGSAEEFRSKDILLDIQGVRPQQRLRFYCAAETEIYTLSDNLIVSPSVRYDLVSNRFGGAQATAWMTEVPERRDEEEAASPKIGVRYDLTPRLQVRANLGRYVRWPNFYELFGDRGVIMGNPELTPEEGLNFDAGFALKGLSFGPVRSFDLSLTYFESSIDNLILFVQNSQRTSIAQNISKAFIWGDEVSFDMSIKGYFKWSGSYTYQKALDRSEIAYWKGNHLPGRPEHKVYSKEELSYGGFTFFHEYYFIGENYLDRANFMKVESRNIHNAGIIWNHKNNLSVSVQVMNIGDERAYDYIGYPLPGRYYMAKVVYKF